MGRSLHRKSHLCGACHGMSRMQSAGWGRQTSKPEGESCAVGFLCDPVWLLGLCELRAPESYEEVIDQTHLRKIHAALQAIKRVWAHLR